MSTLPELCFRSSCICGSVLLEAFGPPIITVACHCSDCRAAAHQIEALPEAAPVLDLTGGTAFLLFRKDRIQPARGADTLRRLKLKPSSATSRYIATCCNAMMYLGNGLPPRRLWVTVARAEPPDSVVEIRGYVIRRLPLLRQFPPPQVVKKVLGAPAVIVNDN